MKQKIKNIFAYFLVPLLLFLLGSVMFYKYLFDNGFGFFNFLTYGTNVDLISTRSGELLAGDKVFGRFTATYPNMGIVSVRFNNGNRDSDDEIIFRLKEEGGRKWYYEAVYKTDQFLPGKLFPFGFPGVTDSSGKNYIFELESVKGIKGRGIFLDRTEPVFTVVSFFNRGEVTSDRKKAIDFVLQKLLNVVNDKENLTSVLIYFLPLTLYIIFLITLGSSFHFLLSATLIPIVLDIFYLHLNSYVLTFSIIFFWVLTIYRHKFGHQISASLGILFLAITPIFRIFELHSFAQKSGVWAYLFLCVAVIQKFYNFNKKNQKTFPLEKLLPALSKVSLNNANNGLKTFLQIITILIGIIVTKKFWSSLENIYKSYLLFWSYYPEYKTPPNLTMFCILIFSLVAIFLAIVYFKRHILWRNKPLIIVLLFVFQVLSVSLVGRFTKFQNDPKIFSISPSITSEAWVDITINGTNLQSLPFVGKVLIAGVEQGDYIIHWSDKKIIVRTNPTVTKSGPVCVQTLSKGNTNCLPFQYNFGKN